MNEAPREPVEEIADDALDSNPDLDTRRESFELDLMEQKRSKEGESVELEEEDRKRH